LSASPHREADDFFYFITDLLEQDGDLQIMYGIGGERELIEQTLDHMSGYDGARPVRIGNGAWDQRQHDVWGVLLDSVYLHTRSRDQIDERRWPMLVRQVEAAIAHWREPDQGLWEVRGPARHFTASKVLCWVAADRGAKLAKLRGDEEHAVAWRKAAVEIHADVCEHGTDDRGGGPRTGAVREAALLRQPAAAVRRGDRPALQAAPGQLPADLLPPGADQRADAPDPRGRAAQRQRDSRVRARPGHQSRSSRHRRASGGSHSR
jgi:GH15 family glucan-1,4-alpha-glucosidase